MRASSFYLQAYDMEFIWPQLNILIVFDVIYITLAYMLFDFVVEE